MPLQHCDQLAAYLNLYTVEARVKTTPEIHEIRPQPGIQDHLLNHLKLHTSIILFQNREYFKALGRKFPRRYPMEEKMHQQHVGL